MDEILELVKRSQKGNTVAFAQIYDAFADKIFRYIKAKVQNQQQAEDILQDVFVKAWKYINQFRVGEKKANFSAWLYRIATNAINDYFRKIYREPETLELSEAQESPSSHNLQTQVGARLETETVMRALKEIPKQYAAVLELRFIQEFSISETAEILGKSNVGVRILQFRALKSLRKILEANQNNTLIGQY